MTRQKKEGKKTGPGARPNWELLRESALSIELDFEKIVDGDHMKLQQDGLSRGQLLEKYQGHISEAVVTILKDLWPEKEVVRDMGDQGDCMINSATSGDVNVSIISDYTNPGKPTLTAKIIAPEVEQSRVAEKIRKIKKKYESGEE